MPIPETISPAIFATRVCPTTRGEIVYHISGAGSPLVFLHGIYPGASSYEWSRVYPDFAIRNAVIAPDLIGFGESERPRTGLDADEHVQALAEFLRTLCGPSPAVIVASGYGAAIALKLAVQHPDRVGELCLFAPLGIDATVRRIPVGISLLTRLPVLNAFVYRSYFASKPFIRGWLARFGYADPSRVSDEVVDTLATCAGQYGAGYAMLAFLRGRLLYDVRTQLPRVTQPVSVLWPDAPDRFSEDLPLRLEEMLANCVIDRLGPLGPLGALESPEVLSEAIGRALGPADEAFGAA